MEFIPLKTRVLKPPQDDLLAVLNESLPSLCERDIIVISSKVVAIHEGNCIVANNADKSALVRAEAELYIPRPYWKTPLTVKHHAFIGNSGIDESNANGHYILLPKEPFLSAKHIRQHLKEKCALKELGVVIVDSHSTPLRRGATGIAIGWWGIDPLLNHVGEPDLFGREMRIEVSNLVDGIAAGANLVMGETNECQPVVITRGVPNLVFTDEDTSKPLLVDPEEDTFRVLYQKWLK